MENAWEGFDTKIGFVILDVEPKDDPRIGRRNTFEIYPSQAL
jgi:hypothetical protein